MNQPPGLSRRAVLKGLALGAGTATAGLPTLWLRPGRAATPPAGAHLLFGSDPTTSMTVVWSTSAPVERPQLLVGLDDDFGMVVDAETRRLANGTQLYHRARVVGLQPQTSYHFQVGHHGGVGDTGTFTTAPAGAAPFRFTAFGDQGVKDYSGAPIVNRVGQLDPAFHFHVGDLSYASATGGLRALELVHETTGELYHVDEWDHWLETIQPVASRVPWMPAVGNHEMELDGTELGYDGWAARFPIPTTGVAHEIPTTYWFRYGNAAFVALDANDVSYELPRNFDFLGGAQEVWLRSTLASVRADPDIDWIVVGYHHCSYCTDYRHGSDGGPRERWGPLFEEFGVDLVVNGHNHLYERTHPVAAAAPTADLPAGGKLGDAGRAPVYVTSGLGDESDIPPDFVTYPVGTITAANTGLDFGVRIPEATDWSAIRQDFASLIVVGDVVPAGADGMTRLTIRAVDALGVEHDRFTLVRSSTAGAPATPTPSADSENGGDQMPATGGGAVAAGLVLAGAAVAARAR